MKNLKEYIIEEIFDINDNIDNVDKSIKDQIKQFLNDNFTNASKCQISEKPNTDGKYEISSVGDIEVKNRRITSFTNGSFIWANIKGNFICSGCDLLTSLEGAPKEVSDSFVCSDCNSLKSLKGAPKEVGGGFYCNNCDSLISLEGSPKKIKGNFSCYDCNSLTSLKGAPKEVGIGFYCDHCNSLTSLEGSPKEVGYEFYCDHCTLLKSLKGAPKEVGGDFNCGVCYKKFYEEDVEKVSNVKGKIFV